MLGALLLWFTLERVSVEALAAVLATSTLWYLAPFLVALAAFCWLKAARWSIFLEHTLPVGPRKLISGVVIGYAGTTLMPMQLGELVRAYVTSRTTGMPIGAVLGSILLERLVDIMVLALIVAIVLLTGTSLDSSLGRVSAWLFGLAVLALFSLAFLVIRQKESTAAQYFIGARLPRRFQVTLREQWSAIKMGVSSIANTRSYARIVVFSIAQWLCMLACVWFSLQAVGLSLPIAASLSVLAATLLGMSLPAGPGYIGTIQVAYLVALAPFGASPESAIAASIIYHVLLCAPLLTAGILWLGALDISWHDLRHAH